MVSLRELKSFDAVSEEFRIYGKQQSGHQIAIEAWTEELQSQIPKHVDPLKDWMQQHLAGTLHQSITTTVSNRLDHWEGVSSHHSSHSIASIKALTGAVSDLKSQVSSQSAILEGMSTGSHHPSVRKHSMYERPKVVQGSMLKACHVSYGDEKEFATT